MLRFVKAQDGYEGMDLRNEASGSVGGSLIQVGHAGNVVFSMGGSAADLRQLCRLSAVSNNSGTMELFAVTSLREVLIATYHQAGSWSSWTDLKLTGQAWDVAAVSPTYDSMECFVVDCDGLLWCLRKDRGHWSGWQPVPGPPLQGQLTRISAASLRAGHREIFGVTDTGRHVHRWKVNDGGWSAWHDAGLSECVDVATCSPNEGLLETFCVDRDGDVWHRWYWENWSEWENWGRPGVNATAVAAFRKANKRQEMFVVRAVGDLAHRWHAHGEPWSGWHTMHSPMVLTDVAVSTTSSNNLHCLAVDSEGELCHKLFVDGWSEWRAGPKASDVRGDI